MKSLRIAAGLAVWVFLSTLFGSVANAGRPIRVDNPNFYNFNLSGEDWFRSSETTIPYSYSGPLEDQFIPFALNFSGSPNQAFYFGAMVGSSWFNIGRPCPGPDIFECGTFAYGHAWSVDVSAMGWSFLKASFATGRIDPDKDAYGQYNYDESVAAVRMTWFEYIYPDRTFQNRKAFDYQMVLLDMSERTGVVGDFDVEVNYGYSYDAPLPAGFEGLTFGPTEHYLGTTVPGERITFFCFRSGSLFVGVTNCEVSAPDPDPADPGTPPSAVSEPPAAALLALAALVLMQASWRRRRPSQGPFTRTDG